MLDLTINYIIPLSYEDSNDFSLFQGFSSGILKSTQFINKILNDLPISLMELNSNRQRIIQMRMSGLIRYSITPINQIDLNLLPLNIRSPFYCIFSDSKTFEQTKRFLLNSRHPVLHISSVISDSAIFIEQVNFKHVVEHARQVLEYIKDKLPKSVILMSHEILNNSKRWKKKTINSSERNHMITLANELVLRSMNYRFSDVDQLISGTNDNDCINALLNSVELIQLEREKVLKESKNKLPYPPCTTIILSLPSIYRGIYRKKINIRQLGEPYDLKKLSQTLKLIQQQKGYSFLIESKDLMDLVQSPEFQLLMKKRQEEIITYSYAISIKACSNFAPCLRFPPALNTLQGDLIQFANCDRTNSRNRVTKINRLYSLLIKKMLNIVDDRFLEFIEVFPYSVKIISDMPLEWIQIRGLPLMIRFNSSRISATPGNLFFQQITERIGILLSPEDLTEILVVRSFKKDDRIRRLLEISINKYLEDTDPISPIKKAFNNKTEKKNELKKLQNQQQKTKELDIKIRFVDISSEDDFIKVLNEFDGQIMIFDGHGSHDKDIEIGSVLLENEKYDVWNLKGKARIPPIVLLSACDTHPLDASHASTANGFLAAGALTVLASVLPLDAIYAAIFLGRLILRLKMYVPTEVYDLNKPLRWINIVSGLQRMSYVTESMHLLIKEGGLNLNKDAQLRISYQSNYLINSEHPNWYENILELIAEESHKTVDEIKELISKYAQFPESMKYIQMGNPEQILIIKKEMLAEFQNLRDSTLNFESAMFNQP